MSGSPGSCSGSSGSCGSTASRRIEQIVRFERVVGRELDCLLQPGLDRGALDLPPEVGQVVAGGQLGHGDGQARADDAGGGVAQLAGQRRRERRRDAGHQHRERPALDVHPAVRHAPLEHPLDGGLLVAADRLIGHGDQQRARQRVLAHLVGQAAQALPRQGDRRRPGRALRLRRRSDVLRHGPVGARRAGQRVLHHRAQLVRRERLDQEAVDLALVDGRHHELDVGVRAHQDAHGARALARDAGQQRGSGLVRHALVGQDDVARGGGQQAHGVGHRAGPAHVGRGHQNSRDQLDHVRLVVNHQHRRPPGAPLVQVEGQLGEQRGQQRHHRHVGDREAGRAGHVLDVELERAGGGVAVGGVGGQGAAQHTLPPGRQRPHLGRARDRHVADHLERLQRIGHRVEPAAGGHLPQRDAQRVDVGAPVNRLEPGLLGREVARVAAQLHALALVEVDSGGGDAEVEDAGGAVDADEDVVRRQVAVEDAERLAVLVAQLVGVVQAGGHVERHRHGHLDRDGHAERRRLIEHVCQGAAVDVLHGHVQVVVRGANLVAPARCSDDSVRPPRAPRAGTDARTRRRARGRGECGAARPCGPGRPDPARARGTRRPCLPREVGVPGCIARSATRCLASMLPRRAGQRQGDRRSAAQQVVDVGAGRHLHAVRDALGAIRLQPAGRKRHGGGGQRRSHPPAAVAADDAGRGRRSPLRARQQRSRPRGPPWHRRAWRPRTRGSW